MTHLQRAVGLSLIFFCCLSEWLIAEDPCSILAPSVLRCEYLENPLGVETGQPRFDWQLTAGQAGARGLKQTAYQIMVCSTPGNLSWDNPDMWDSGKVASGETCQIVYSGKPLFSREGCFWKVRVWDQDGRVSEWSKPAQWEMGLLEKADWKAKWIDVPLKPQPPSPTPAPGPGGKPGMWIVPKPREYGPVPILRKQFTLPDKPILSARLYITALGLYEMHINGQKVGDALLTPDWTEYTKRVRYDSWDVTSLLKAKSPNVMACLLGNGWYCGHIGNDGFQAWGKLPALLAQLEITYADYSRDTLASDGTWTTAPSPILSSDFMLGEDYDARKEIPGWDEPGDVDATWDKVQERTDPQVVLNARVMKPVAKRLVVAPVSLNQVKPGVWIYDFGQNLVGVVHLKLSNPPAGQITLRHGEMLNPDGTLYTANLRGASSIDHYYPDPEQLELEMRPLEWQPRFTFHGFRYVELTGVDAPTKETLSAIVEGSVATEPGKDFFCSHDLVNHLHKNIRWGMQGNYLSVPMDCPQRDERMGWMGDTEIFIRSATYLGDIAPFMTNWLVDVDDAQMADGVFMSVAPCPRGGKYGYEGVPGWGDAGVICPWTIYQVYGDKRILETHLPAMTRWVEWCKTHSTNLIRDKDRGHDYGDWLNQGEETPKDLIGTAFFAHSADLVARSYAAVGQTEQATAYHDLFGQIAQAFAAKYVSADGHVLGDTQTGYALALEFGLVPENLRKAAVDHLVENIARHQNHLTTGFVGVSHLLPALSHNLRYDTAYDVLTQETFPSWLFSVKQGATTIWERWDGWTPEKGFQSPSMNSFNHYSLGSCGEWLYESVGGIDLDPDHPGFSHVIIAPVPAPQMTFANETYHSIHGPISTKWKVQPDFSLTVSLPVNVTATVYLPTKDPGSILEGGKPIPPDGAVKVLPMTERGVPCEIGSGTYVFGCK